MQRQLASSAVFPARIMAFVIRIDRGRRQASFRLRVGDIFEIGLLVPRTPNVLVLRQIEHKLDRLVRRDVSEERIIQLAHGVERLHEHIGVGDLAGQKMMQSLLGALVVAGLDQRLVGLAAPASAEMFALRSRTTLPPSWI